MSLSMQRRIQASSDAKDAARDAIEVLDSNNNFHLNEYESKADAVRTTMDYASNVYDDEQVLTEEDGDLLLEEEELDQIIDNAIEDYELTQDSMSDTNSYRASSF